MPVPADYDGDGVDRHAVYRPPPPVVHGGQFALQFGQPGDIPVPADYNGDGKTDIAVYRPSTGVGTCAFSSRGSTATAGDIPVPGDYNGDGRADFAVYRPSTGHVVRAEPVHGAVRRSRPYVPDGAHRGAAAVT